MSDSINTSVGGVSVSIDTAPSAAVTKPADFIVTDERGRQIKLKKPGVLAQFHLVEALGPLAQNQVYMGMILPLIFIVAIDGEPVVKPGSKAEVEALIQRLDEEGVQAVMTGVQKHFAAPDEVTAKNG